jgi:hypothetical protein
MAENVGPRCTATIMVEGQQLQCERMTGAPHLDDKLNHRVTIKYENRDDIECVVRWTMWRKVQPANN